MAEIINPTAYDKLPEAQKNAVRLQAVKDYMSKQDTPEMTEYEKQHRQREKEKPFSTPDARTSWIVERREEIAKDPKAVEKSVDAVKNQPSTTLNMNGVNYSCTDGVSHENPLEITKQCVPMVNTGSARRP